ncbi:secretion protein HlyD, partial [Pseudomonas syringae pv. japonica str. M301072]
MLIPRRNGLYRGTELQHLGIGEMVSEASNAFTLSDLSRVWATFGVAPRDLDKVVVGRPVIVSA